MGLFKHKTSHEDHPYHPRPEHLLTQSFNPDGFTAAFGGCSDLVRRDIYIGAQGHSRAVLFFIDGTVSGTWVSDQIVRPLTQHPLLSDCHSNAQVFDRIIGGGIYNFACKERSTLDEVAGDAVSGCCVLFIPGEKRAVSFEARGFPMRGISEPSDENVMKGGKDSFIENLRSNTALVRHRIKTPELRIVETVVGRQSRTMVSMVYIENLTNPELVSELESRLQHIDIDAVLLAADLEEHLTDNRTTTFPLLLYTERCDRFCNGIVTGQIGLLINGFPFGYLMPMTFAQLMKAPEDFARHSIAASFITLIRYAALIISLMLPAFYIAILSYHKEMIPTNLAEAIIRIKKTVPFSSLFEVLGMLVAFEILLEAGLRLPKTIGQAVSIVGALVIGQAAVEANLISPVVVIVVALAGICGFTLPNQDFAMGIRMWRLLLVFYAAACGIMGISVALIGFLYRMASLESFGVPYMAPFSFDSVRDMFKRTFVRPLMTSVKDRPGMLDPQNKRKQK